MPRKQKKVKVKRQPTYRLHAQSGQAIVTLTDHTGRRKDCLLGTYGSEESQAAYQRLINVWLANNRRLPPPAEKAPELTVAELILAYMRHAETYYVAPDKNPTSEYSVLNSTALTHACTQAVSSRTV